MTLATGVPTASPRFGSANGRDCPEGAELALADPGVVAGPLASADGWPGAVSAFGERTVGGTRGEDVVTSLGAPLAGVLAAGPLDGGVLLDWLAPAGPPAPPL